MSEKIIVVLGATGNQGGSVVSTFLKDPKWHVRAVTRDSSSDKASTLASRGAEVIEADMDNLGSLLKAFHGAHAVFVVTEPFSILFAGPNEKHSKPLPHQNHLEWATNIELQQFKNTFEAAAKTSSLDRLIVASLTGSYKFSGGKYKHAYHLDSKANAEEHLKEMFPELSSKTSIYVPGWFLTNIREGGFSAPRKASFSFTELGVLQFPMGFKLNTKFPIVAPEEDSGPIVHALINEPTGGKKVLGLRGSMTCAELLALFEKSTGHKAEYIPWPEDFTQLPLPAPLQQPIVEMIRFVDDFGYDGGDVSVILPKDLAHPPKLESIEQYLQKKTW